ncbi:hypothetical protein BDB01DRAFT_839158 [Pilobolus umbonatus]|nr:hypothetical protein BDB01DRAFT_839158 [Pilobolus umbonatus]
MKAVFYLTVFICSLFVSVIAVPPNTSVTSKPPYGSSLGTGSRWKRGVKTTHYNHNMVGAHRTGKYKKRKNGGLNSKATVTNAFLATQLAIVLAIVFQINL